MMKTKKLFVVLILCVGTKLLFSQTYYPISDTNAVWDIVLYPDPEVPDPPLYLNHFRYTLKGDTLVNGNLYQKLIRTNINRSCSNYTSTELHGLIRNDPEARKVYFRDMYMTEESLLYDFNLQVGDTLRGSVFMFSDEYMVGSIDSILINENYHKRYSINLREFFFHEYLIEGIGTTIGLVERVSEFWPFYNLRCFSQDGQLEYLSPMATECRLESDTCYVGIDVKTDIPKVRIFPNPVRDYLYVSMNNTLQANPDCFFTLYDITGRILYRNQFTNSLKLNCSTFSKGLVFYRISSSSNQMDINGKILFQ